MNVLSWLFGKRQPYNTEEILNDGLELSLAFGKNWLQPIQGRLKRYYPALSNQELDYYNEICQNARRTGHVKMCDVAGKSAQLMSLGEFTNFLKQEYPWASAKVIKAVYNQGLYYVYKDYGNLSKNT